MLTLSRGWNPKVQNYTLEIKREVASQSPPEGLARHLRALSFWQKKEVEPEIPGLVLESIPKPLNRGLTLLMPDEMNPAPFPDIAGVLFCPSMDAGFVVHYSKAYLTRASTITATTPITAP